MTCFDASEPHLPRLSPLTSPSVATFTEQSYFASATYDPPRPSYSRARTTSLSTPPKRVPPPSIESPKLKQSIYAHEGLDKSLVELARAAEILENRIEAVTRKESMEVLLHATQAQDVSCSLVA